jgi:hypothetical protein
MSNDGSIKTKIMPINTPSDPSAWSTTAWGEDQTTKEQNGGNNVYDFDGENDDLKCCTCCRPCPQIVDSWETLVYIWSKLVPLCGRVPACRSCKSNTSMSKHIAAVHIGTPVTSSDAEALLNLFLLLAALFLAFVAASATLIDQATYIQGDLVACQEGWAHQETCLDLDLSGYFPGSPNATGLVTLHIDSNGTETLQASAAYTVRPGDPVDMSRIGYGFFGVDMLSGMELPSMYINRCSAISAANFMLVVLYGIGYYLVIVFAGTNNMDSTVMLAAWNSGMPLLFMISLNTMFGVVWWCMSMWRIMPLLLPNQKVTGVAFFPLSTTTTVGSQGYYFVETCFFVFLWGIVIMTASLLVMVMFTCKAEKNYVLKGRPSTPKQFVELSFRGLMDNDNNDDDGDNETDRRHIRKALDLIKMLDSMGLDVNGQGSKMATFIKLWPHLNFERAPLDEVSPIYVAAMQSQFQSLYNPN